MAKKSEPTAQICCREIYHKEIDFKSMINDKLVKPSKNDSEEMSLKQRQKLLKSNTSVAKKQLEYWSDEGGLICKNINGVLYNESSSNEFDYFSDTSVILSGSEPTTVKKKMSSKSDLDSSQLPSENMLNSMQEMDKQDHDKHDGDLDSLVQDQVESPVNSKIDIDLHANKEEFNTPEKQTKGHGGKVIRTKRVKLSEEMQAKMQLEWKL